MFDSPTKTPQQAGYDLSDTAGISILLDDGPILVVNKPAGLPTETPRDNADSLVNRVKDYLKQKYNKPGNVYLGIPQRLDTPVSGAIVFARNSKCAARLSEQFAERDVGKVYWAVLKQSLPQKKGMLCDWMKKHPTEARAVEAEEDEPTAKEARLTYEVVSITEAGCLCRIELLTGRMHQIRWQFGSRGFPIVGDQLYGAESFDDEENRILLHARELTFQHPIRYDEVQVVAPLPDWWPESLKNLNQGD